MEMLNYRQKCILKRVIEIEEATSYQRRCIDVHICPKCGENLGPGADKTWSIVKCKNNRQGRQGKFGHCDFEVYLPPIRAPFPDASWQI